MLQRTKTTNKRGSLTEHYYPPSQGSILAVIAYFRSFLENVFVITQKKEVSKQTKEEQRVSHRIASRTPTLSITKLGRRRRVEKSPKRMKRVSEKEDRRREEKCSEVK
jgi:hypothetical protein